MRPITKTISGMSLIEYLVAMTLGSLVLGGLVEIMISNKLTLRTQEAMARMQENGRYADYMLSRQIRMAGYQGCASLDSLTPNILVASPPEGLAFTSSDVINGYEAVGEGVWSPALPATIASNVVPDTDVIVIRKASELGDNSEANMASSSDDIDVTGRVDIVVGDVMLVTDCESVDIFEVTSTGDGTVFGHAGPANTDTTLSKAYVSGAYVSAFESFTYYLRDSGEQTNDGTAINVLVQRDLFGNEIEIIDGVDDMQLQYGADTDSDGNVDTYMTADAVDASDLWDEVFTVRVALLLSSVETVGPIEHAYVYEGETVSNPGDRLMRREWNSFITLRNRALF